MKTNNLTNHVPTGHHVGRTQDNTTLSPLPHLSLVWVLSAILLLFITGDCFALAKKPNMEKVAESHTHLTDELWLKMRENTQNMPDLTPRKKTFNYIDRVESDQGVREADYLYTLFLTSDENGKDVYEIESVVVNINIGYPDDTAEKGNLPGMVAAKSPSYSGGRNNLFTETDPEMIYIERLPDPEIFEGITCIVYKYRFTLIRIPIHNHDIYEGVVYIDMLNTVPVFQETSMVETFYSDHYVSLALSMLGEDSDIIGVFKSGIVEENFRTKQSSWYEFDELKKTYYRTKLIMESQPNEIIKLFKNIYTFHDFFEKTID